MRPVDYIALSIPIFFALIGVEWVYARLKRERLYRLNDSVSDLSTGILDQVLGVFTKAITVGAYAWVWQRFRVSEWDLASGWTWLLCFVGVDFFYYWFHRVSHESNLPWGAHIVHHSSEEYNLSVALRQGAFQSLWSFPFYLPLAWIGFPPLVFLACSSFDTLYQFWIHTRAIKTLGPLEWILNTPSHHRVHHGCDAKYIDRNYAGTLIVWDRLFGSFQPEEEEPVYGITKPLASWNPVWANFHHYADLARASRRAPSTLDAVRLWLKGPGWQPAWVKEALYDEPFTTPLVDGEAGKYDRRPPRPLIAYAMTQFVLALGATMALLWGESALGWSAKIVLAGAIVWTVLDVGLVFDGRVWAVPSELLRLAAVGVALCAWAAAATTGATFAAIVVAAIAAGAVSAAWLLGLRRQLASSTPATATT
jgi:alkylglycerol monooxygenase